MLYCDKLRLRTHYYAKRTMAPRQHITSHCSPSSCREMAYYVLLMFVLLPPAYRSEELGREGFMDRLSNGMKFAQGLLGSESVALKVADFVVRAFQTTNNPKPIRRPPLNDAYVEDEDDESIPSENRPYYEINEIPMTPFRQLVKLFGLQPNQISAVAVNALVFVAQMISTFLAGPRRPSKPYRSDDPTSWILNKNSRKLQELLTAAKNESLSDNIEDLIKDHGTEEETSCIRLLVCKITPFVFRMQETVFGNGNGGDDGKGIRGAAALYKHLPSPEEIKDRSSICEQRHRECNLNE